MLLPKTSSSRPPVAVTFTRFSGKTPKKPIPVSFITLRGDRAKAHAQAPVSYAKQPVELPKSHAQAQTPTPVLFEKIKETIELFPQRDDKLGHLIIIDPIFTKTLGATKMKVHPENVQEFFQYLLCSLASKRNVADPRSFEQRISDVALLVKKVMLTVLAKQRAIRIEAAEAAKRVASSHGEYI